MTNLVAATQLRASLPPYSRTSMTAAPAVVARPKTGRWAFVLMGLAGIAIAAAGFVPSLLFTERRLAPVTPLVALHAAIFTAWLGLFVVQAALVATRRTALHRKLGFASVALVLLMLPLGYVAAIEQTRRGFDLSGDLNVKVDPLAEVVHPLFDLVTFTVLFAAGMWKRRQPETHKRLMLLATIGAMMPAALAHIAGHFHLPTAPPAMVLMLAIVFFAPAFYDRVRLGRFHPVT